MNDDEHSICSALAVQNVIAARGVTSREKQQPLGLASDSPALATCSIPANPITASRKYNASWRPGQECFWREFPRTAVLQLRTAIRL